MLGDDNLFPVEIEVCFKSFAEDDAGISFSCVAVAVCCVDMSSLDIFVVVSCCDLSAIGVDVRCKPDVEGDAGVSVSFVVVVVGCCVR